MAKLNDLLGRALAVPGVRAVALVGREGLLIASVGRGTERLFEALGALGANALNLADALGQEIGQGLVVGWNVGEPSSRIFPARTGSARRRSSIATRSTS